MLDKIMGFMFGKSPDIFDQDGNVRHHLEKEKWSAWANRFRSHEYDWHKHKGTERGGGVKRPANPSKNG
jgi:hypothetical protein